MRRILFVLIVVGCAGPADGTGGSSTGTRATTSGGPAGISTSSTSTTSASSESAGDSTGDTPRACNGHAALCNRALDLITFPTTHNSAAATSSGFSDLNANQVHDLATQLDDGIRGMMLDVTEDGGETVLCHGPCGLGRILHLDALATIGAFLDQHPHEVLLIIYEDSTSAAAIAADWASAGLESQLFVKGEAPWTTLGEMIDADTRIVVTAENGGPPPPWFHHAWDLIWDTPYTFHDTNELTCDPNRGTPGIGLLLVNHWLSTDADLPDAAAAATMNAYDLLYDRARACEEQGSHPVNLLAVDFYDTGDLFAVVDALNGV